ncbi:bifunctional diguanylate cyclase/phosphodiesterase [Marinomonas sp. TW1]|uniref:bifunctional diguanylate cyclase/phosphodiesterase n=1 Tax=Marinomonas sp. TW1 TaxID=1561203 RepID=UPI0007AF1A66|nr:EAL domain-containing protein [Marinomonas sp. TW1]KZN13817.1 diguanylate cyclase [Marinomonas sp. TW1]
MALIKKNIWAAFYLTAAIWLVFFGAATFVSYQTVYEEYTSEQKRLMALTANSIQSILRQYEVLLDLVAKEVIAYGDLADKETIQNVMDSVVEVDNSMLGVGLFLPHGDVYVASSGVKLPPSFNILSQPENRDSFQQTLETNRMVLGRTYQSDVLKSVVFPLRKSVVDQDGNVLFVLSTVINIPKGFRFFFDGESNQSNSNLYLYRDSDRYFQMVLSHHEIDSDIYNYQIPQADLDHAFNTLEQKKGLRRQEIKQTELEIITTSVQPGPTGKAVSRYIAKYDLWAELKLDTSYVMGLFFKELQVLIGIFASSLFLIFLLFRSVASNEKRIKNALEHQASHDYLTALHNRFYLDQQLSLMKRDSLYYLIFIDLDNFKAINDGYGHEVGDKVLCLVAERLQSLVNSEDVLVRYSGDEFIIVVFNQDESSINLFCKAIQKNLALPAQIGDYRFVLSASIGIAAFPEDGQDLDELKRYADLAMYEAKKTRNTITFFREDFKQAYQYRAQMEQELKKALLQNELYMMYQPQIRRDGSSFGVEALVRWENKLLGFVPPDKFIAVAEACGLMLPIGEFIIDKTFTDMTEIQKETGLPVTVSINISVRQFQHNEFFDRLIELMEKHTFIHVELVLEVTENLFIDDVIDIQNLMKKIREKGIRISLDDFGTGYSSLSLLNQLPIDELKIDKSFVDDITTNSNTLAMVEGIIAIARRLNITTVVEGVENDEQRQVLADLQCDIFQGYHFSKPLKLDDLKTFMTSNTHLLNGDNNPFI